MYLTSSLPILCILAIISRHHTKETVAQSEDSSLRDAVQLLQIEKITELEVEIFALKKKNKIAEGKLAMQKMMMEKIEMSFQKQLQDKQKILRYAMNVLQNEEKMIENRQHIINVQGQQIDQNEKQLQECHSLKSKMKDALIENQKVLRNQARLENMVKINENLTAAYEQINKYSLDRNYCEISSWVSSIAEGLSSQKKQIDELTSDSEYNKQIGEHLQKIQDDISRIDVPVQSENLNLTEHYHDLILQQSQSISMFRGMIANKGNSSCGLRYTEDENGVLISGDPCNCLPLPPSNRGLELLEVRFDCSGQNSLSYSVVCEDGSCDTDDWPHCDDDMEDIEEDESAAWQYFDCQAVQVDYLNRTVDCGAGGKKVGVAKKTVGRGVLKREATLPCLECTDETFQWSDWSWDLRKRIRSRGSREIAETFEVQEKILGEGTIVRLAGQSLNWDVQKGQIDAINFISSANTLMKGIYIYGSNSGSLLRGELTLKETSSQKTIVVENFEISSIYDTDLKYNKQEHVFSSPAKIVAKEKYTITLEYFTNHSIAHGEGVWGEATVSGSGDCKDVIFQFSSSAEDTNGTDDTRGQITEITLYC